MYFVRETARREPEIRIRFGCGGKKSKVLNVSGNIQVARADFVRVQDDAIDRPWDRCALLFPTN